MQERGRFFLIILNLATIEVIMHLEEQTLDEIMNNSELLGKTRIRLVREREKYRYSILFSDSIIKILIS